MTQTIDNSAAPSEDPLLSDRPLASPWARFWARVVDINLWSSLIAVAILLAAPAALVTALPGGGFGEFLATLVLIPVMLLMDALVQSIFGSTPGKFLAGIRLETMDGRETLSSGSRGSALAFPSSACSPRWRPTAR